MAVCLEVCTQTWELQGVVRFHMHMFLKSIQENLRMRRLAVFEFKCVRPHVSTAIGGMPTYASGRASWSGFFYCSIRDSRARFL